jgi:hypothetical protein
VQLHHRQGIATVHELFDPHQLLAQLAAGMQIGKVFRLETLLDQHCHGQRVAHGQGRGRAGSRHQVHGTGFFRDPAVERDVGGLGQRRLDVARDGDQARANSLQGFEDSGQFLGLAAVRHGDDDIVRLNDAKVAVHGLGWVKKESRRAGAG